MNSIWIARDLNDSLCAYSVIPVRDEKSKIWRPVDPDDFACLPSFWFPEVTWESEPIELVIKEKEG